MVGVARVKRHASAGMLLDAGVVAHEEAVAPEEVVRLDSLPDIVAGFGQRHAPLAQGAGGRELAADHVELALPAQHREQLVPVAQLLAEPVRPPVGVGDLDGPHPFMAIIVTASMFW